MSESPNVHSSAVPVAQTVGLLDVVDPMKFSKDALLDPPSYVRNFAHAVAGHQASLDNVIQATEEADKPFANAEAVVIALQAVVERAKRQGFIVEAVSHGLVNDLESFHVQKL